MTDLVRWDPFQEMTSLRDAMSQLLAESFVWPGRAPFAGQPAMDLYETDQEFVVKLAVPGLKADSFEITMRENELTIHARTEAEQPEGARYHLQERRFGEFTRSVCFPSPVHADKVQARLADGILTIRAPKVEAARPRRIAVKAG
ncbi:MAG: Hsp20/alpha crystallin family protein [Chloroflexi bacterium OHK40]|jgi:HSP20 family protein